MWHPHIFCELADILVFSTLVKVGVVFDLPADTGLLIQPLLLCSNYRRDRQRCSCTTSSNSATGSLHTSHPLHRCYRPQAECIASFKARSRQQLPIVPALLKCITSAAPGTSARILSTSMAVQAFGAPSHLPRRFATRSLRPCLRDLSRSGLLRTDETKYEEPIGAARWVILQSSG